MGNCACSGKVKRTTLDQVRDKLILAVESGRLDLLEHFYRRYMLPQPPTMLACLQVDDWIIELQEEKLNTLAYAFRAGQTALVQFLINKAHASVDSLYAAYKKFGRSPIDVACEYGFLELLQFFLPIHLGRQKPPADSLSDISLFADAQQALSSVNQDSKFQGPYQPAVHRACERGHVHVIEWLCSHFQDAETIPEDFDVNARDERAGENCALLAARQGSLKMLTFLHEKTPADFHQKNRRNESAIQVAAIGSKRREGGEHFECIKYLVESVGVDVTYEYEETLLICEDKGLIAYLESQLRKRGIEASKEKVDNEYSITRNREPRTQSKHSVELETRLKAAAGFQLCDFLDASHSRSYLSSIPQRSALDVSELSVA